MVMITVVDDAYTDESDDDDDSEDGGCNIS